MRSWPRGNGSLRSWGSARFCSGRFLKRALWGLCLASTIASAQTPPRPTARKVSPQRANELTLARLRPGRDTAIRALARYKDWPFESKIQEAQLSWHFPCEPPETLTVDIDEHKTVQVIRLAAGGSETECEPAGRKTPSSGWKTGRGLRVGDPASKVARLYGQPDSRSPSTRDGQPLELMYYAFDWAGPYVPQVMEVLCTREKDGQPGRVVEITLAAPSL